MERLKQTIEKREQTIATLQQVIAQQKQLIESTSQEKQRLEKQLSQLNQQKFNDDLSFENQIRKLKLDLEQKCIQLEGVALKRDDHGLMLLKLRNELEEPHKIELDHRDHIIAELKDQIVQWQQKCRLADDRLQLLQHQHLNDVQQMKEKYQEQIAMDKLQLKQLKELNLLNQKDQDQIQDLLREKEGMIKSLNQKDLQLRDLRLQLDKEKSSRDTGVVMLTQQLEQERIVRRRLETEKEELETALQNIRMSGSSKPQSHEGQSLKGQDEVLELQNRLAEYMRLFEEEKDQKRRLSQKLNDIIQQSKQEKLESDRIYENRIKDLMEQLKEEKNIKQKQSIKIKDLYQNVEELKHENFLLLEQNQKVTDKEREIHGKERKLLEKELQLGEREAQLPTLKPLQEIEYENKKLRSKYKVVKGKLEEANKKIIVLLAKVKDKPVEQHRRQIERDILKDHSYQGYYELPQDADIMGDPYTAELKMDKISQRLREDLIGQRRNLESLDHKFNQLQL